MTTKKPMDQQYPELNKLKAYQSSVETLKDLFESMSEQGLELGKWEGDSFIPANVNIEALIHNQFDIDLKQVEKERQAMLSSWHT